MQIINFSNDKIYLNFLINDAKKIDLIGITEKPIDENEIQQTFHAH